MALMFFHRYFGFEGDSSGLGYSAFSALDLITWLMGRWVLRAAQMDSSMEAEDSWFSTSFLQSLKVRSPSQCHV